MNRQSISLSLLSVKVKTLFKLLEKARLALIYLIYPRACFYCNEALWFQNSDLCSTCLRFIFLVDEGIHCPFCFFKEKAICSQMDCSPFKANTAIFYRSIVFESLWEHLRTCDSHSDTIKAYKALYLFKALNMSRCGYSQIIVHSEEKNEKVLMEMAKWVAKKMGIKTVCSSKKCAPSKEPILILSDYLKGNSSLHELADKLKGGDLYAISLIANIDPDPNWIIIPVGLDPFPL